MYLRIGFVSHNIANKYKQIMNDEHIDFNVINDNAFCIHNVTSLFYDFTDVHTVFCKGNNSFEINTCDLRVLEIKEGE